MKIYAPIYIAARVVLYSMIIFGISEGVLYDAGHPLGDCYFGEITFVEITQETLLFILLLFYFLIGYKWKGIQPVSNMVALFFLISFFREFNFLKYNWLYPALIALGILIWLAIRDFKKIKKAAIEFFSVPASSWLLSGFLVTYVFSRLMGRSKLWRLLYEGENYRLAKGAAEESIELLGDTIMLISAIEFLLYFLDKDRFPASGAPTSKP